jgi:cation:H+ antiporter
VRGHLAARRAHAPVGSDEGLIRSADAAPALVRRCPGPPAIGDAMGSHLEPTTILALVASLLAILASAELFTNGIEWLGHRLSLAEGAVGSVLAAVGTALPETLIPFVAILIAGGDAGAEIGVGAILGAPFMLSTLAMFVTGVAVLAYRRRREQGSSVVVGRDVLRRDLHFFLVMYGAAVAVSFAPWRPLHIAMCCAMIAGYVFYLRHTFADEAVANGELQDLRFQRLLAFLRIRRNHDEDVQSFRERRASEAAGTPRIRVILSQVLIALGGILGGAYIFVGAAKETAEAIGVAPLLVALVIAPIATELPEKFNSVVWMRQGKDTYALGNITGAMVFQSSFPVSLGMAFTSWRLLAPHGHSQAALHSVALALAAGLWLLVMAALAPREKTGGDQVVRIRLHPAVFIAGGLFYAAFIILLIV